MGVSKEGLSAGAALVTDFVCVLKGLRVRNDLAMTGEIAIFGKAFSVGGIQLKLQAAYKAGVKEVLIPADNVSERPSSWPWSKQSSELQVGAGNGESNAQSGIADCLEIGTEHALNGPGRYAVAGWLLFAKIQNE